MVWPTSHRHPDWYKAMDNALAVPLQSGWLESTRSKLIEKPANSTLNNSRACSLVLKQFSTVDLVQCRILQGFLAGPGPVLPLQLPLIFGQPRCFVLHSYLQEAFFQPRDRLVSLFDDIWELPKILAQNGTSQMHQDINETEIWRPYQCNTWARSSVNKVCRQIRETQPKWSICKRNRTNRGYPGK